MNSNFSGLLHLPKALTLVCMVMIGFNNIALKKFILRLSGRLNFNTSYNPQVLKFPLKYRQF